MTFDLAHQYNKGGGGGGHAAEAYVHFFYLYFLIAVIYLFALKSKNYIIVFYLKKSYLNVCLIV